MLLENLVTRRVSEENASDSSLTRRVTKQGHLLLAALAVPVAETDTTPYTANKISIEIQQSWGKMNMEGMNVQAKFVEMVAAALGEQLFTLLDVGCSGGIDPSWRQFGKHLRAFGFDPSLSEVERLNADERSDSVEYIPCFVGVPDDISGSERLKTQQFWDRSAWSRLAVGKTLELRSQKVEPNDEREKMRLNLWNQTRLADAEKPVFLCDFVEKRGVDNVDFVKIDVDGPDFLILRSIVPMLKSKQVLGVGIEVNFYGSDDPDVNTFHNVDRLLRAAGFDLFDLSVRRYSLTALPSPYLYSFPAQSKTGRPFQGDALYLRDLGSTDPSLPKINSAPVKYAKLAALFALFGQPDSAAELLLLHREELSELFDVSAGLDALLLQSRPQASGTSYSDYITAFQNDDPMFYRAIDGAGPFNSDAKDSPISHLTKALAGVFRKAPK